MPDHAGQTVNVNLTVIGPESDQSGALTGTLVRSVRPVVGGRVTYVVEQVLHSEGSIDIPAGKAVLTVNNKSNEWLVSELAALKPGDLVDIDVTSPDARWAEAEYAVGGMYKLVTNGVAESGLSAELSPRSAVGVRADGTAVFYTVDGRQTGYSIGATLAQVAGRLIELGCVEAVCLDGGGSTTMGAADPGTVCWGLSTSRPKGTSGQTATPFFLFPILIQAEYSADCALPQTTPCCLPGRRCSLRRRGGYGVVSPGVKRSGFLVGHERTGAVSWDGIFTASGTAERRR